MRETTGSSVRMRVAYSVSNQEPTDAALRQLLADFARIPPAPCDSCPMREVCATQRMACSQFVQYVNRGRRLPPPLEPEPTQELLMGLMKEIDQ